MNLKRRLVLANAAAVIIPVIITVLFAWAFIFGYGKLKGEDLPLTAYQKLAQVEMELISNEGSVLRNSPEVVEQEGFQKNLRERMAGINGEVVILKEDQVLFASRKFDKIDLAKLVSAGEQHRSQETVAVGDNTFTVENIDLSFQDGTTGGVLLLVPAVQPAGALQWFLILNGAVFILSFLATNILGSYQLSRSILKPLSNLQKAAAEIAGGNLSYVIGEEGDREIQDLCRDLESMRVKLKDLIHAQSKYEDNRKMLISSISHDLKTPITSIKGYVEGIFDGVANTPEKTERYLQTIYTKTRQVDQMIDDLLLYARLDLNQLPFNFEMTDAEEYLQGYIRESEPELESWGIEITLVNEMRQKRPVLLDRERMRRVLTNILDNSRKYMDKSRGEITLFLRETASRVIMEVRDNGSGIKQEDLPYIFERFYRGDPSRAKGSGLGLAISKQIVEGHKGRVWAISHGEQGTSIMISLPIVSMLKKRKCKKCLSLPGVKIFHKIKKEKREDVGIK